MQPTKSYHQSNRILSGNDSLLLRSADHASFDNVWPTIEPLMLRIFTDDTLTKAEWQDIFWKVHITCVWDYNSAVRLQQKFVEIFTGYINEQQAYIFSNSHNDHSLLKAYMVAWKRFMFYYRYVPLPFAPLERYFHKTSFVLNSSKTNRADVQNYIRLTMIQMWVLNIFSQINSRLVQAAMWLIDNERNNITCDPYLIIGVKESCLYLCSYFYDRLFIYRNNFERIYIQTSETFYQSKGQQYYIENGVLAYMKWVDSKLREEKDRATRYLETHSISKVIASCVNVLVSDYKEIFSEKFLSLIKNNDVYNLNLMFELLDRVENGISQLLEIFQEHLISVGLENLRMEAAIFMQDSEKYIDHLLKMFYTTTEMINESFRGDPRFMTTRDKAFNQLINDKSIFTLTITPRHQSNLKLNSSDCLDSEVQPLAEANNNANSSFSEQVNKLKESRSPELFANYCDMLLRKTNLSRHLTSEQIESKLKNIILLLKYVQDKDMFMKFYKSHLIRRLILDVTADNDKEELMVNWLREVGMPADFVNKLSRMFQDLKVSDDFNRQLRKVYKDQPFADVVSVKILNTSAWSRVYEKVNISLPGEIEEIMPKIESFYKKKHNGRNLLWYHQFSSGVLTYNSDFGSYDFEVTSYQLSVLFCWNDRPNESLTLETLVLSTQLSNLELRRTLWSLTSNQKLKSQILLVDSSPVPVKSVKDFRDSTTFKLNLEFSLQTKAGRVMKRGRLNLIGRLQLNTDKCREEAESILRLRAMRTQEAIVKIMKMRKSIQFSALQLELTNVLKQMFVPSKVLVKEQLEWLIENDYIHRDSADSNLLLYN